MTFTLEEMKLLRQLIGTERMKRHASVAFHRRNRNDDIFGIHVSALEREEPDVVLIDSLFEKVCSMASVRPVSDEEIK